MHSPQKAKGAPDRKSPRKDLMVKAKASRSDFKFSTDWFWKGKISSFFLKVCFITDSHTKGASSKKFWSPMASISDPTVPPSPPLLLLLPVGLLRLLRARTLLLLLMSTPCDLSNWRQSLSGSKSSDTVPAFFRTSRNTIMIFISRSLRLEVKGALSPPPSSSSLRWTMASTSVSGVPFVLPALSPSEASTTVSWSPS